MLLDAPALSPVLTPEQALGIIQKSVSGKGWKKYDVAEIKLVYSPYWLFSFDISAEGSAPSGKAALNAYTGELSDLIPMLLDRPHKKTKETEEGCEIESTAISPVEVKETAQAKVSIQAGLKKENVVISAVSKVYVPFYRVWVDIAGDTFRIDIDASMGIPVGAEAIPKREKSWDEVGRETLDKMKTPKGWIELGGETLGSAGGAVSGKGKGPLAFLGTREGKLALAAVIIVLIFYFSLFRPAGQMKVDCKVKEDYLGPRQFFGLFGEQTLQPKSIGSGNLFIEGECSFINAGKEPGFAHVRISVKENGKEVAQSVKMITVTRVNPSSMPTVKVFNTTWSGSLSTKYSFSWGVSASG
ncbi:hypothetical protein HY991_03785 [Candidatus Micrarchaeota archaeon]|nr:hypothetical protein [Candidatus Micrarchaeota archaeon]